MEQRREEFIDHFVRAMLAYALARNTLLSDTSTVDAATLRMVEDEFRIGTLVEAIITSRQFLNKRCP